MLLCTLEAGERFQVVGCPHLTGTVLHVGSCMIRVRYDGERHVTVVSNKGTLDEKETTFTAPVGITGIAPNTEVKRCR